MVHFPKTGQALWQRRLDAPCEQNGGTMTTFRVLKGFLGEMHST